MGPPRERCIGGCHLNVFSLLWRWSCSAVQSCVTLCDPMDQSPPGCSVCGISQASILEWIAISSSRGSSRPRDWPTSPASPALPGRFFITELPGEALWMKSSTKTIQGCCKAKSQESKEINLALNTGVLPIERPIPCKLVGSSLL